VKNVRIQEDQNMSDNRQKVLNYFKQGHLLDIYETLTQYEKDQLTEQLELIQFDVIDLVSLTSKIEI